MCFPWDIIWAYARVQIKHALSISSDPRAAVGTNTHSHTHFAMYAWMFFYAWYVIYVKCRWELKDGSVWGCQWFLVPALSFPHQPQSRSEPVVCWCLFCWLCCLRMFACAEKCQIPWMVMLQKRKMNKREKRNLFSTLSLNFSNLHLI